MRLPRSINRISVTETRKRMEGYRNRDNDYIIVSTKNRHYLITVWKGSHRGKYTYILETILEPRFPEETKSMASIPLDEVKDAIQFITGPLYYEDGYLDELYIGNPEKPGLGDDLHGEDIIQDLKSVL